ncbi:MAG: tyrosine-type recombinase/integrase [Candidatus Methanoperedens sp.]|nr:tyrosine-type recombinase/integrase [Candidatus Methanoperedens sp.]
MKTNRSKLLSKTDNHLIILDDFRVDLKLRNQAKTTIKTDLWNAKKFIEFLEDKPITEANKEDIKRYLAHLRAKGLKQLSISRMFSCLSVFFDYLVEAEIRPDNPVLYVRKRYLQAYKIEKNERHIISIKEAIQLVNSIIDTRDKTIVLLLFKTGMRRKELLELDLDSINFDNQSIEIKPTPKRTNRIVFLDSETSNQLKRWIQVRESWAPPKEKALFINRKNQRLTGDYLQKKVAIYAMYIGLHDPKSEKTENHFSPHCCRHWHSTYLLRSGMRREYVKWLRGDVVREAIDIYFHIDPEDVKQEYLDHIPRFGL